MDLLKTNVSTETLSKRIGIYAKALGISLPEALEYQAGLLKAELVTGAPPRNIAKAQARAERDIRKQFHPAMNSKTGAPWSIFAGKKAGTGQVRWLYAGPKFIAGTDSDNIQSGMTSAQIQRRTFEGRNLPRVKAWQSQGKRGNQHVSILHRVVVKPTAFKNAIKLVRERFGRQKAAWAVDWDKFKIAQRLPQWIRRHLPTAKGITVFRLNNPDRPYIQIISRATGVEQERSIANVRRAVKKRYYALQKDLALILEGVKDRAGFMKARARFK